MINIYKEIFKLVQKTGEKLVIINPDVDDAVVVLPYQDYAKILEGPRYEEELNTESAHLDMNHFSGRIDDTHNQGKQALTEKTNIMAQAEKQKGGQEGSYFFEPLEEEGL